MTTTASGQDTPQDLSTIITVVGVLGGILILTVLIAITGIVICCVHNNKRTKVSVNQGPPPASVNGHLGNGQLVDNPSNLYNTSAQPISNQLYNYSDNQREMSRNRGPPPSVLSTANGLQSNDQLVNNPSYNISDHDLELVNNQAYHCENPMLMRNQAYNRAHAQNLINSGPQLVTSPASSSNGQEDPYYSVIHDC